MKTIVLITAAIALAGCVSNKDGDPAVMLKRNYVEIVVPELQNCKQVSLIKNEDGSFWIGKPPILASQ